MRRLLQMPRTITGQITLLIGASLILANVLSIGVMYFVLASSNRAPTAAPGRAATVAQLASVARPQDVDKIVDLASKIGVHVTRISQKELETGLEDEGKRGFLEQRRLDHFLAITDLDRDRDHVLLGPNHTVAIQLRDGNGLAFPLPENRGPGVPRMIAAPVVYILTAIAAVLISLSIYAARSITSPLSSFAEVAYSVGRTAHDQRIVEKGPTEIAQVARALNEMGARITALLDERVGMLTAISHDLRTPLTRIRLRAERIARGMPVGMVAEGMLADISRMEQMLSETLIYMRDSTRGETVPVDLPSVLQTICAELSDLGKDVQYLGPSRLAFCCQPGGLTRAISNLVDNGLKYGNQVTVELRSEPAGAVQIDVTDDGPGIPYSLRKRVFEPFFKTDTARTANQNGGFGLGLSIARNIIKAHGGEIELFAVAPHGTRVHITLPQNLRLQGSAEQTYGRERQHTF
jgi:signal transduction histidine kinase